MEFLYSNCPPCKTGKRTFVDAFNNLFVQSTSMDIAVGYVSADSLVELQKLFELNPLDSLRLTIGMHYIERFTKQQYDAAMRLNEFLNRNHCGEVRLVTPFRFHGKMYVGSTRQGPFAGIIGSNNLSSIVDSKVNIFEASAMFTESGVAAEMKAFLDRLNSTSTKNIAELEIEDFMQTNSALEGQEFAEKVSTSEVAEVMAKRTDVSFEIPVKSTPQSNLNAFFGKGREGQNGLVTPRHWYEAELIVSNRITLQPGYPVAKSDTAVFDVVTDDGWKFKCKVSGDFSKNLRSEGDLKILGRWLKGRLEAANALQIGEPVTDETLTRYGRNTFTFTKTTIPNLWYLDFGVKKL